MMSCLLSNNKKQWHTTLNSNNVLITKKDIQKILKKGGVTVPTKDLSVWQRAFVHKSYIVKNKRNSGSDTESDSDSNGSNCAVQLQERSNERLEWLGDAQLQAAVTQYLFRRYPDRDEGFLTKLRSKLVKTKNLAFLAKKIGLEPYLVVSHHVEFGCQGRENKKMLENTFEAFIGAMYTDFSNLGNVPDHSYGYDIVRQFVITLIEKYNDIVEMILKNDNYKDSLMWFFQKTYNGAYPIYHKEKLENDNFHVYVKQPNSDKIVGRGSARSKKQAEQLSAKNALYYYSRLKMTKPPQ